MIRPAAGHTYRVKRTGGIWIAWCTCCPWESGAATFDRATTAGQAHTYETQGVVG